MSIADIKKAIGQRALGPICFCILCGILYAGLNPFTAQPPNEVSWAAEPVGLRFGDYGMIKSSGPIRSAESQFEGPCSIEILIQPGAVPDSNTILAFYTTDYLVPFSVRQWGDSVELRREVHASHQLSKPEVMGVDHIFRKGLLSLISVTSDTRQTSIYVDGTLADTTPNFHLSNVDLTGELEMANSPVANDSWSGILRGVALYDRPLNASQALDHYRAWISEGRPGSGRLEGTIALYLFKEGKGKLIHNEIPSGPNLYVPEHYGYHGQPLLVPPWKEFQFTSGYAKDILINVAGFVPLGFFFCAYFSAKRWISHPALATILLGGAISLTIEIIQAYLPTRDSGMTDVITNTLGTGVGVWLYGCDMVRVLLERLGILVPVEPSQPPQ
jgi:hypothetical protein